VTEDGKKVTTEVAQKQLRYFPITHRLKRLFISKRTARHMRWHKEDICENNGVMGHLSDSEAWNVLDRFDSDFAVMQEMFTLGWQQMVLMHLVLTLHHTLASPSLLYRTIYQHLFV
jgi:hypothetical protein